MPPEDDRVKPLGYSKSWVNIGRSKRTDRRKYLAPLTGGGVTSKGTCRQDIQSVKREIQREVRHGARHQRRRGAIEQRMWTVMTPQRTRTTTF